jgi:glycine/D-amino acid oxidase-like deaminating enzyme
VAGYGSLYWAERTARRRRVAYPTYRGQHEFDVVVVGGGLTGCTAAYVFAHAGLSVALVESNHLASGSTAAGLGVLLPQPDAAFRAVESAAGLRVARTAWKGARRSTLEFASALKKLKIKCDLEPTTLVVNGRTPDAAEQLRREQSARNAAGVDVPWLTAPMASRQLATESAGAIRSRDAFLFDPVRATLGLAAAATAKGAKIFEKSTVKRTRYTRKHADVVLATGSIRAKNVYVATGGPGDLFTQLRRHVRELSGYVVATDALSAPMKRASGSRGSVVGEPGETPHWLRWLPDGRALFAGGLSKAVGSRQLDKAVVQNSAELMYELSVRHPVLSGLPAKWGWHVPVISTSDGLPWIGPHRNYPFHFFALAFGWHGDGLAWLSAKAALRSFTGESTREDQAFVFVR